MSEIFDPSVKRIDHEEKVSGTAKYVGDYRFDGMLYAAMVRSEKPHARVTAVKYPAMEEGYYTVDASDLSVPDYLRNEEDGQQIFATSEVNYIGEGIAMICGPDEKKVRAYVEETEVEYEDLPAVYTVEEAEKVQVRYHYVKADVEESFRKAAKTYKEAFQTGYQAHMYLEPNGMLAIWKDDKLKIYGSMQNPYYIKNETASVFHLREDQVEVQAAYTGGGFGGKEDYPSLVACQTAAAAMKTGRPVRFILPRREDMADSPKRHPVKLAYEAALDEDNRITGMRISIVYDGGAYQTVSATVMQRSMITCIGAYNIPSLVVDGVCYATNKLPSGAFRGFGAPQTHFAMETFMNHVAEFVGEDPLEYKKKHLPVQGDLTSTNGVFRYPVIMPEMIEKACGMMDYEAKRKAYASQTGRYRKGIGMGLSIHGCGFTGSAEKDFLKSVVSLHKYPDDRVEVLASNMDIGQGVKTAFAKIVAKELELPMDRIISENPNTDRVPNSGPTVASRSVMIPGRLLQLAAKELKKIWKDGEDQVVFQHYVHPSEMIPWELDTFSGDPYPTYSWGVNIIEVETDMLTGESHVTDGCGVYDVGTAVDERIMRGQIEGGMLQGIGYASMENMEAVNGRIMQNSFTDYMIPTSMDTVKMKTCTVDNLYDNGPFGAKGAGELTLLGSGPAFVQAVEQSSGGKFSSIPVTPEKVLGQSDTENRGRKEE